MHNLSLRQIADSGQVFRFNQMPDGSFEIITRDRLLKLNSEDDIPGDRFWKNYFDLDTDYSKFSKAIPREDRFLTEAAVYSEGIRILNQDPWEMLISFIISQRKSIPAIRTSIEKLCERFGKKISGSGRFAFPTPDELAKATREELESCSLGYRTEYVYLAARRVATGEVDLEALRKLDDAELKAALLSFKGVGEKVANCVMLFGYHRIGAFPVDVWMKKMIDEHYAGSFPLGLYGGFAGVIQQYIFFFARESAKNRQF